MQVGSTNTRSLIIILSYTLERKAFLQRFYRLGHKLNIFPTIIMSVLNMDKRMTSAEVRVSCRSRAYMLNSNGFSKLLLYIYK